MLKTLFCRCTIWFAVIITLVLFVEGSALAAFDLEPDNSDIFAREDIRIESGQTVGRLLVAGGTATVSGVVEKGVVVVDGNLIIKAGAHIKDEIVVLGGYVKLEDGARLEQRVLELAPGKTPVAGFVILGLLLVGIASLVALPIVVWLTARIVRNTRPYLWVKERFLLLQQRWPALYIVLTLVISGLMLVLFADMAWETLFSHEADVFDNAFIWLVRYFSSPGLDQAMIMISELGYGYPFWGIILTVLVTLAFYQRRLEAAGMLVCLGGAASLNLLLKHLFERSRPELFRVVEAAGFSFPSGHAMVSLCVYGMLAFLIARYSQRWRWRLAVCTLAVALVAAIGVSRVYLGVHYPTDVVAGYTAGATWLAFCISLLMWWEREREG
jgi:undecaprenyl-diphosphatase